MKRFSQYLTVDLARGGLSAILTGPSVTGLKGRNCRVVGLMLSRYLPVQGLWTSLGQKTSLAFQSRLQANLWAQEMRSGRAGGGSMGLFLLLQLQRIWRPGCSLRAESRGAAGRTELVL